MKKVFRVLISETQGFYVDIEADNTENAKNIVRQGINSDTLTPIEDNSIYTGYVVEDAQEIKREDADLQTRA